MSPSAGISRSVACYRCNRSNHLARSCWWRGKTAHALLLLQQNQSPGLGLPWKQGWGKVVSTIFFPQAKCKHGTISALLDSGGSHSLVSAKLCWLWSKVLSGIFIMRSGDVKFKEIFPVGLLFHINGANLGAKFDKQGRIWVVVSRSYTWETWKQGFGVPGIELAEERIQAWAADISEQCLPYLNKEFSPPKELVGGSPLDIMAKVL